MINKPEDDRLDLPLTSEQARHMKDLLLIDRILSDPILREVHAMRIETVRYRRIRRRRVAMAATLLLGLAGAGAYGYLASSKPADNQADPKLTTNPDRPGPALEIPAPKPVALADKGRFGRVMPIAPSLHSMHLDGRDIPLYSADEPGANPGLRYYVYAAPIRVVEEPRFDPKSNQVAITLDMTAPDAARDKASKEVADALAEEGATRPKVVIQPLAFRSYNVQLIADETEGSFKIGSAGDRGTAVLTADKITFNATVPESMPILREKLRTTPGDIRVQLRAEYDFERLVQGSVSLTRADGAVHRVLDEVRPKLSDRKINADLYVDRQARDAVEARLSESIKTVEANSGLSPEAFATFLADARQSISEYFASLPRRDPYQLITRDTNEVALIFTAPTGQIDAKAILTRDKITYKEKSEEYTHKASEALKVVQDVLRKGRGEFNRSSHKEMRDKLGIDAKLSLGFAIFSGSAALKLDKSSEEITGDDLKTMNEHDNRDYWMNDAQRSQEMTSKVQEKVAGDMNLEKALAKTLDYYRLDERQLASTVEAAFTRILSQGLEGLGLLSETNLIARPTTSKPLVIAETIDSAALSRANEALSLRVKDLERELRGQTEQVASLKGERSKLQTNLGDLQTAAGERGRSIDALNRTILELNRTIAEQAGAIDDYKSKVAKLQATVEGTARLNSKWYFNGDPSIPCFSREVETNLLLISGKEGKATIAHFDPATRRLTVEPTMHWPPGLVGVVSADSKTITWTFADGRPAPAWIRQPD